MPAFQMTQEHAQFRDQQVRLAERLARRRELTTAELTSAVDATIGSFVCNLNAQFGNSVEWRQHASSSNRFPPLNDYPDEWRQLDEMQARRVARVAHLQATLRTPQARERIAKAIRIHIAFGATYWNFEPDTFTEEGYGRLAAWAAEVWGADWECRLPQVTAG